jgi:hypothetical protein
VRQGSLTPDRQLRIINSVNGLNRLNGFNGFNGFNTSFAADR